ncbi:hypothetical protein FBU59_004523 [Linderina macrospora]|uniref:Uncharacterized protein n=1 Tax=Linderina macrospora TaxID=4868 RepID=A0ACC1J5B2_9FUNG|nr:hypothetical protein FBU59_004523 [Linderina macrospora]
MSDSQLNIITVRIIKNFEYRTCKNLILKVDLANTTIAELKELCKQKVMTESGFKPYRTVELDTLKIYTQAFGHKTQNLIINLEDEGFLRDEQATLEFAGIRNETELSFFNMAAYTAYANDPKMAW